MASDDSTEPMRILVVADHASLRFGGEAALPLHYFRVLVGRGEQVWLVVHERTRDELHEHFPEDFDRIFFIRDTWAHKLLWKAGRILPRRLAYFTFGMISRLMTQIMQRRIVKQAVSQLDIDVVHQPMPVSPREPSMLFNLGAPVVIGPMNGGMNYPPAFTGMQSPLVSWSMHAGRLFARTLNILIPGKRRAAILLVANERTRQALPLGRRKREQAIELMENGVDLGVWLPPGGAAVTDHANAVSEGDSGSTRFVYIGRLVDWKAVNLLLDAFARVVEQCNATLTIIGDGAERSSLESQAQRLGLLREERVQFTGFLSQPQCAKRLQQSHVLVLPSLLECGGAVVLEAMAMGLPVIATNWGGPTDYLDDSSGILVAPSSEAGMIEGFADAMVRLAESAELRQKLGHAGRHRVLQEFDWEAKVERIMTIYRQAGHRQEPASSPARVTSGGEGI